MYFSKVTIKQTPEIFTMLKQAYSKGEYALHQLIWNLFPNDGSKKRDFLFRKIDRSEDMGFYILSKDEPKESQSLHVLSKPFTPKLKEDQKLSFSIIVNPVKTVNGKKHDVWIHAKKRAQKDGVAKNELVSIGENAVKKWFEHKGSQHGYSVDLDNMIVNGYMQHKMYAGKHSKHIQYSSAHIEGVLTVTDPDKFITMLHNGMGKSKAFGCGLMMVKKI